MRLRLRVLDGTGELPAGWAWARLSEICDLVGGVTVDAKRTGADLVEVPYLRVANVQRGRICLREVKTIRIPQTRIEQLRLASGDVLLNEGGDRDKVGRGWVWEGQVGDCVFQNHIFRARPRSPEVNPFYVSHYLNEIGRSYFLAGAKQTTNLASLSLSKVAEAPVMLAPPAEQTRIISEVVRLFAELDEAEAVLARARAGLAEYRASLLHAACTGQLTAAWRASRPPPAEDGPALLRRILAERRAAWERAELARLHARGKPTPVGEGWKARYPEPATPDTAGLPELPVGWTWATVDQLLAEPARNGISVEGRPEPPGTPALRLDALGNDGLRYDRRRFIDIPAAKAVSLTIAAGDFLVSRANGSLHLVGRGCLAGPPPEPTVFPDTMIRLRFILPGLGQWVSALWGSRLVRQQLERRAKTTAGIQKIGQEDLQATMIPLPPDQEMAATLQQLADGRMDMDAWPDSATVRQSILHAAFTGRLMPQDPADEPAAALLARLRAAPAAPRRGRAPGRVPPPQPASTT